MRSVAKIAISVICLAIAAALAFMIYPYLSEDELSDHLLFVLVVMSGILVFFIEGLIFAFKKDPSADMSPSEIERVMDEDDPQTRSHNPSDLAQQRADNYRHQYYILNQRWRK